MTRGREEASRSDVMTLVWNMRLGEGSDRVAGVHFRRNGLTIGESVHTGSPYHACQFLMPT
jgi:hypothetical protein